MGLENFIRYCEQNNNTAPDDSISPYHKKTVEELLNKPSLLGLIDIKESYYEVPFEIKHFGINGAIDLVFVSMNREVYLWRNKNL